MTYTQYRDFRRTALDLAMSFRRQGASDVLKMLQRAMVICREKRAEFSFAQREFFNVDDDGYEVNS